jgi:hypothetical protein
MITIRKALSDDTNQIWNIFHSVVHSGDTYAFAPNMTKEAALSYWMGENKHCYVAKVRKHNCWYVHNKR